MLNPDDDILMHFSPSTVHQPTLPITDILITSEANFVVTILSQLHSRTTDSRDLGGSRGRGDSQRAKIFSILRSLSENLAKSYVGVPHAQKVCAHPAVDAGSASVRVLFDVIKY